MTLPAESCRADHSGPRVPFLSPYTVSLTEVTEHDQECETHYGLHPASTSLFSEFCRGRRQIGLLRTLRRYLVSAVGATFQVESSPE